MAIQTQLSFLRIAYFRQIVPQFFYEMLKAACAARQMLRQGPIKLTLSHLKICFEFPILQNRRPNFPADDEGRARGAENVFICFYIQLIFLWIA